MKQLLLALLAFGFVVLGSLPASAEAPYRRPGLGGVWVKRNLTAPMNSLALLAGPGQNPLFGQRFDQRVVDAGGQYSRFGTSGSSSQFENQGWTRLGVVFGLTEDWEAGALFLPFQWAPEFDYSNILVYITRGFRFDNVDIGLRLSFQTPEHKVWSFNPSVPILLRLGGRGRIDTGLFFPFANDDPWWAGIHIPVRGSVNATPNLFFGLETGYIDPRFGRPHDSASPLGGLMGYTLLAGSIVLDFTATFTWDNFVRWNAPLSVDTLQASAYRMVFGVTTHRLVK